MPNSCLKLLALTFLPLTLMACVSSSVEQLRNAPLGLLSKDETIVLLGRRQNFRHQTEKDFTRCVYNNLLRQKLPVKPEQQFMDEMFPWFQPRMAPLTADALAARLQDPALAERLQQSGTRYVVWLDGITQRGEDGGSMSCSIGVGGAACLGLLWWEDDAEYEAVIWDMQSLKSMGKIAVEASGTSYVPAVIIPIPLLAPTQSAACRGVAKQIGEFLSNKQPAKQPARKR